VLASVAFPPRIAGMALQSFIEQFGLAAVFAGCLLEGETVLVLGAVAAHLGYLALPEVLAVAAVAGFLGDQIWFSVGRRFGPRLLARRPALAQRVNRAQVFLERHGDWIIVFMRFAIGLRIAIPIALGSGPMPRLRYVLLNALGAVLWSAVFGAAGYAFGAAVVTTLARAERDVEIAMAAALIAGIAWLILRAYLARRRRVASGS
jgi:membrane protein DedA with SNARE-associated domain